VRAAVSSSFTRFSANSLFQPVPSLMLNVLIVRKFAAGSKSTFTSWADAPPATAKAMPITAIVFSKFISDLL
jgi:hypothetical protein